MPQASVGASLPFGVVGVGPGIAPSRPTAAVFRVWDDDDEAKKISLNVFRSFDKDLNGYLDAHEVRRARDVVILSAGQFGRCGPGFSDQMDNLLAHIDDDADGRVDDKEWHAFTRSIYEITGRKRFLAIADRWITTARLPVSGKTSQTRVDPLTSEGSLDPHGGKVGREARQTGRGFHGRRRSGERWKSRVQVFNLDAPEQVRARQAGTEGMGSSASSLKQSFGSNTVALASVSSDCPAAGGATSSKIRDPKTSSGILPLISSSPCKPAPQAAALADSGRTDLPTVKATGRDTRRAAQAVSTRSQGRRKSSEGRPVPKETQDLARTRVEEEAAVRIQTLTRRRQQRAREKDSEDVNADPRGGATILVSAVCDQINERSDLDPAVWNEHVTKGPQRLRGDSKAASAVKAALHNDGGSDDEESDWEMLLASLNQAHEEAHSEELIQLDKATTKKRKTVRLVHPRSPVCPKSKERESPMTTLAQLWEHLTSQDRIGTRLEVTDVADLWEQCSTSGLDMNLRTAVPQAAHGNADPEQLSVGQVVHICEILVANPLVSDEAVFDGLREATEHCRHIVHLKDAHIEQDLCINWSQFRRLIRLIAFLMSIDEVYIVTHMMWLRTRRFEMTDAMFKLYVYCSQKTSQVNVMNDPFTLNDFVRTCYLGDLIDGKEQKGLSYMLVNAVYYTTLSQMPELVCARWAQRSYLNQKDSGHRTKPIARTKQDVARGVLGKTEHCIMLEALFAAMPKSVGWRSPLHLVVGMLLRARETVA